VHAAASTAGDDVLHVHAAAFTAGDDVLHVHAAAFTAGDDVLHVHTAASATGAAVQQAAAAAASAFDASELPWSDPYWEDSEEPNSATDDKPCAAAPVPQDAASSYLATCSHPSRALTTEAFAVDLARGRIVDTKPPPVWLVEQQPSPTAMVYHDDVLVVHGGAGVLPGAAAVALADTGGDPTLPPSLSATHPST
jgi:hypothetical protein